MPCHGIDQSLDDGHSLGSASITISLWVYGSAYNVALGIWDRLHLQSHGACSNLNIHGGIVSLKLSCHVFIRLIPVECMIEASRRWQMPLAPLVDLHID